MKNYFIVFFISFIFLTSIFAQEQKDNRIVRNNIYIEFLGNGFIYSLNYERFFDPQFSLRTGAMLFTANGETDGGQASNVVLALFPIMFNYLINFGSHNLEIGAGPELAYVSAKTDLLSEKSGLDIGATLRLGYMYFPPNGGFNFSIAYTPILSEEFTHSFGIGFGYGF